MYIHMYMRDVLNAFVMVAQYLCVVIVMRALMKCCDGCVLMCMSLLCVLFISDTRRW